MYAYINVAVAAREPNARGEADMISKSTGEKKCISK